ncbi:MAG: hypothetical protein ACREOI_32320 [bacterium]
MRCANFPWRCLFCWFMLLSSGVAFSQNVEPDSLKLIALYSLKKGQRIRAEKSDRSVIAGNLRALKDDSLLFSAGSTKVMAVSVSDLQTLWVRTNSAREGGRVGAILGVIPGAIWGSGLAGLANIDCESHCVDLTGPRLIGGAIGGLMGAAGGMASGSIIGAAIPQWQRVYP